MESTRDSWGSAGHNPSPCHVVQDVGRLRSILNDGTRRLHPVLSLVPRTSGLVPGRLLPLRPTWVSLSTGTPDQAMGTRTYDHRLGVRTEGDSLDSCCTATEHCAFPLAALRADDPHREDSSHT